MHLAAQVNQSMFELTLSGQTATRAEVLPGWGEPGRLGIIVREPFGAIGASLLVLLAVTAFYDARTTRRTGCPQYPEIYLIHVGGRYGDHRPFDFWPPRKEVFLGDSPLEVLEALNDRAITVLAVPERAPHSKAGGLEAFDGSGAPWSELNSFRERTTAVYLYSPDGQTVSADLTIRGLSDVLEQNAERAIEPERSLQWFQGLRPEQLATALPGPGTLAQTHYWARTLTDRFHEVGPDTRALVNARRKGRLIDGKATETYRRLTPQQALGLL
jgi:hypothetical protein